MKARGLAGGARSLDAAGCGAGWVTLPSSAIVPEGIGGGTTVSWCVTTTTRDELDCSARFARTGSTIGLPFLGLGFAVGAVTALFAVALFAVKLAADATGGIAIMHKRMTSANFRRI
jgi:hypothetical protein